MGYRHEGRRIMQGTGWTALCTINYFVCNPFFSLYHHNVWFFQSCFHIPQHRWYAVWQRRFFEVDVKPLLALESGTVRVKVMQLRAEHPNGGSVCLPHVQYGKVKLMEHTIDGSNITIFLNTHCR